MWCKRIAYWLYVRWSWLRGEIPTNWPGISVNADARREYDKMVKRDELSPPKPE